jgi:ubiquinone/menaquinone biosynthesis C-methylase UbiE
LLLAQDHAASYVCGIDVEDTVLAVARQRIARAGLEAKVVFLRIAPGRLPFPAATFNIVFSKASIVHIPDKYALMAEAFRILKPGVWLITSYWLTGHDNEPSPQDEGLYRVRRAGFWHGFIGALSLRHGMSGLHEHLDQEPQ